jgi:NAD dependent epimerase/dehydratase family enzyme
MADALLLSSARVVPKRLIDTGYAFLSAELEPALRRLLGRL